MSRHQSLHSVRVCRTTSFENTIIFPKPFIFSEITIKEIQSIPYLLTSQLNSNIICLDVNISVKTVASSKALITFHHLTRNIWYLQWLAENKTHNTLLSNHNNIFLVMVTITLVYLIHVFNTDKSKRLVWLTKKNCHRRHLVCAAILRQPCCLRGHLAAPCCLGGHLAAAMMFARPSCGGHLAASS